MQVFPDAHCAAHAARNGQTLKAARIKIDQHFDEQQIDYDSCEEGGVTQGVKTRSTPITPVKHKHVTPVQTVKPSKRNRKIKSTTKQSENTWILPSLPITEEIESVARAELEVSDTEPVTKYLESQASDGISPSDYLARSLGISRELSANNPVDAEWIYAQVLRYSELCVKATAIPTQKSLRRYLEAADQTKLDSIKPWFTGDSKRAARALIQHVILQKNGLLAHQKWGYYDQIKRISQMALTSKPEIANLFTAKGIDQLLGVYKRSLTGLVNNSAAFRNAAEKNDVIMVSEEDMRQWKRDDFEDIEVTSPQRIKKLRKRYRATKDSKVFANTKEPGIFFVEHKAVYCPIRQAWTSGGLSVYWEKEFEKHAKREREDLAVRSMQAKTRLESQMDATEKTEKSTFHMVTPPKGLEAHHLTRKQILETDQPLTGHFNSIKGTADPDRMINLVKEHACANDKPPINHTEEERQTYGMRCGLDKDDPNIPKPECRRVGHNLMTVLVKMVKEMLAAGIIERCYGSPTGAPIMLVPKKKIDPDDPNEPIKYRLVIDYRKINALLRPETYPTPSMSDTVHSFRQIAKEQYEWDKEHGIESDWDGKDDDDPNGAVLSVLDFSRAFYSVPMHPDSKWATTMIIPQLGAFQWKSAPMGMRTSPSTFCRYAANRLRKYSVLWEEAEEPKPQEPVLDWHGKPHPPPSRFCITYIDDCAICTASYYTHHLAIQHFLNACHQAGLWINTKSVVACKRISYVGYSIGYDGIACNPHKVEAIRALPDILKDKNEIRMFLGKVLFHASWIPAAGQWTKPLYMLLKKDIPNRFGDLWTDEHTNAVKQLKRALSQYPVLRLPDPSKPWVILTDASKYAGAACLAQADKRTGELYIVEYMARVWPKPVTNYTVTELELLIILLACRKWHHYLAGCRFTARIISDHRANADMANRKKPISQMRLASWHQRLSEYDVRLEWAPGDNEKLSPADCLSRMVRTPLKRHPQTGNTFPEPSPGIQVCTEEELAWTYKNNLTDQYGHLFEPLKETKETTRSRAQRRSLAAHAIQLDNSESDSELDLITDIEWDEHLSEVYCWPETANTAYCRLTKISMPHIYSPEQRELEEKILKSVTTKQQPEVYRNTDWIKGIYERINPQEPPKDPKVLDGIREQNNEWSLREGLLYRNDVDGSQQLVIVDTELQEQLCQYIHEHCHAAPSQMAAEIKKKFYWPKITHTCKQIYNQCCICPRIKPRPTRTYGALQRFSRPVAHGVSYAIDFITDLPSAGPHRYDTVLCVRDRFSHRTFLIPCHKSDTAAETAGHIYHEIVLRRGRGLMAEIRSDRDTRFADSVMQNLLFPVQLRKTNPNRSISNGLAERAIQSVEILIRSHRLSQRGWISRLPHVEYAINTRSQPSLGGLHSIQVEEGRDPLSRIDLHPHVPNMKVDPNNSRRLEVMKQIRQEVDDCKTAAWSLTALSYNKRHLPLTHKSLPVGAKAFLLAKYLTCPEQRAQKSSEKLRDRRWGPYTVQRWVTPTTVELNLPKSISNAHNVFHVSRLLPYSESQTEFVKPTERLTASRAAEDEVGYEVDTIVCHRKEPKMETEYLVRFVGYGPEDSIWLPESELQLCAADVLKSYQRMVKSMPTGIQPDWLADPPPKKEPKIRTKTKAKSRKT